MGTGRALPLALALLLACSDVAVVVAAQVSERIQGTRRLVFPSFLPLLLGDMLGLGD
jgi:hypothetical protein